MPSVAISFAQSALRDLEAIQAWYDEQDAPDVGRRLVAEIVQRVASLPNHPDIGRVVPEFSQPFLRGTHSSPVSHRVPP